MEEDYDLIFKIILVGDSGVGKSNIVSRYLKDEFKVDNKATVGVEFGATKVEVKNAKIKAQIWDTAGQERYKSITNSYYKGSKGALVVYDVSKKETFENVERWITELKVTAEPDVNIILIGNKCDLINDREVSVEEGKQKANILDIAFIETSAMTKINIENAFVSMVEEIYKKYEKIYGEFPHEEFVIKSHNKNAIDLSSGNIASGSEKIEVSKNKKMKKSCC